MAISGRPLIKAANGQSFYSWLRSTLLSVFILALSAAIMFILVSMIVQMLNSTGGQPIQIAEQEIEQPRITTPARKPQDVIRVEVLNGCGVDGIAGKLREYLIARNFDVVDFKNYSSYKVPQTLIIDRTNMEEQNARKVAEAIGVSRNYVFPQISPLRKLDVTVIIGSDYKNLNAFR